MEKGKDNPSLEMRLLQILETKFQLCGELFNIEGITYDTLKLKFGFKLFPEGEDKLRLAVNTIYIYDNGNAQKELANIEISTFFWINNLNSFIEFEDGKFNDKTGILPLLLDVSVGATRGYIASKLAGTVLSKFPLPIFDIDNLLFAAKVPN